MRLLTALAVVGLWAASAAAEDPPKAGKATVTVVGKFTADKDSTLNYTLKLGGKVVAEGKGVSELPGKGAEVDAAGAAGPYELTLTADGGVVMVTEIGVTATADGKTWKGMWNGRLPFELNQKDPFGVILRGVTFPLVLAPEKTTDAKPDGGKSKTDGEPKKLPDLKKSDEKKPDEKKPGEGKTDPPKLPVAPAPRGK